MADDKKKSAEERLQEEVDERNELGFIGVKVDPTPNENYSAQNPDAPTPETDPELAAKAGVRGRFDTASDTPK